MVAQGLNNLPQGQPFSSFPAQPQLQQLNLGQQPQLQQLNIGQPQLGRSGFPAQPNFGR
jgi:hypothetical protein